MQTMTVKRIHEQKEDEHEKSNTKDLVSDLEGFASIAGKVYGFN